MNVLSYGDEQPEFLTPTTYDPAARVPYNYASFPLTTNVQKALYKHRLQYQPQPHTNPNSVLVASVGTLWEKGARQRVRRMCEYHATQGFPTFFEEIPDTNIRLPYQDIGHIRDVAITRAMNMNVEWLCLVDCDVLPTPELLTNLMSYELPMLAPAIIDPVEDATYSVPRLRLNTGFHKVRWFCFSFVLFRTAIFNSFPGLKMIGDDMAESTFFERLWRHGHQAYMQTDLECKLATPPTGMREKTWDEWLAWMEKTWGRRLEPIDRESEVHL
tara:strand:- start:2531 stop:3346 length:816 start_codon:yes stop_codon:yes gene_type:complete